MSTIENFDFNAASLGVYIRENFPAIYDFFILSNHSCLLAQREEINKFLHLRRDEIIALDFNVKLNIAFLTLLVDVSERLRLRSTFRYLFDHLEKQEFSIARRLKATKKFIQFRFIDEFVEGFDDICCLLQQSLDLEEDDIDRIQITFINYYATVIEEFIEFNPKGVQRFRDVIIHSCKVRKYSFLDSEFISEVVGINIDFFAEAQNKIQNLIDKYFARIRGKRNLENSFIIEVEGEYSHNLENIKCDFHSIRQLSVQKCRFFDSDKVYITLDKGEALLINESQLFSYMKSYGKMHYEKLMYSFRVLPSDLFDGDINIVDWGCGQGIASMAFLDYMREESVSVTVRSVTLIEPSEIALRRASLHIKKYLSHSKIITIRNDMDSLTSMDIMNFSGPSTIHLFSNVLDMNKFSLTNLINIIKSNYAGTNYFLCVSPFRGDMRNSRIDSFVEAFATLKNFTRIKYVNKESKTANKNWTLVLRVFRVDI